MPRLPFRTLLLLFLIAVLQSSRAQPTNPALSRYETRAEHNRDGIGKFYMGREIAIVMGHQAADWLERPERETEERPDLTLQALKPKPGDVVADIGDDVSGFGFKCLQGQVGPLFGFSFGSLKPIGCLVAHDDCNFTAHVKLADAITIVFGASFIAGESRIGWLSPGGLK